MNDPTRRRLFHHRWLLALAGLALIVLAGFAGTLWWLTRDEFATEVQSIGGRYRSEIVDSRTAAFMKALNRQALTVFHWIDLESSEADDAWLQSHRDDIQRQTHLTLFIRDSRITATGLKALRGLENIHALDLTGTPLDDTAVETIVTLPNAVQLYIGHSGISDSALAGLSRSPHLVFLCIDRTQATPEGIEGLTTCPNLEGVWLLDADDECIQQVAELPRLTSLMLRSDQLTIACFPTLKKLQKLQVLSLFDSDFTEAELAELRRALPGCIVQQMEYSKIEAISAASWE